jgi:hypothetical protein
MTEREFRLKYPHSTDEQVRLYAEAVKAQAASPKPVAGNPADSAEPDIPMPMVTVPERRFLEELPQATSYSAEPSGTMRDILLGFKNSGLSPEQRQQFQHMSDDDMLAMFFDPQMFRPEAWH